MNISIPATRFDIILHEFTLDLFCHISVSSTDASAVFLTSLSPFSLWTPVLLLSSWMAGLSVVVPLLPCSLFTQMLSHKYQFCAPFFTASVSVFWVMLLGIYFSASLIFSYLWSSCLWTCANLLLSVTFLPSLSQLFSVHLLDFVILAFPSLLLCFYGPNSIPALASIYGWNLAPATDLVSSFQQFVSEKLPVFLCHITPPSCEKQMNKQNHPSVISVN